VTCLNLTLNFKLLRSAAMFKCFSTIALLLCCFCYANHHASQSEILTIKESWVREMNEDKLYVYSEQIYPSDQGIFLHVGNDQFIEIPTLYSDANGCYVLARSIKITKPCPLCGFERLSGAFPCKNPECPSNKK